MSERDELATARFISRAHAMKERLEATLGDLEKYLDSVKLRDGDWPIYEEFTSAASMMASVLTYLSSSERMTLEQAQEIITDDYMARFTHVIEEAPEIGYRVVLAPTSRGSYKSGYFLQCQSRLKSRAGQWVNTRGPYTHEQTAILKLREEMALAKAPSNARVFPSVVE